MNQAVLDIAGIHLDELIEKEKKKPAKERLDFLAEKIPQFLSEQQKSKLILRYIQGK